MKNLFLILALVFTVSSTFAQAGSNGQQPTDTRQFVEQQVDIYAKELNTTQAQDKQIDAILDKRYDEYEKAKANVTDPKALRDLRRSYLKSALLDLKQVLTPQQWSQVEAEIDNRKNFSLK